jgi:hypothetical protein
MLFEIQSNESKGVPIKRTIYFYPLTYFRQIGPDASIKVSYIS